MQTFDVSVEDVVYRHPLQARLYRPKGTTAWAAVVDVHGGAWTVGDRTQHVTMDSALASMGVLVASIDFRQPPPVPEHSYPTSLIDVNYGIRWLKKHMVELGVAPGARVGLHGGSSGGHVVILAGMRPHDPRYSVLPLEGNAEVDFVVTDAPVTDPCTRYRNWLRDGDTKQIETFRLYWTTDQEAEDGSLNLILKRHEPVSLPPLLITQGTADTRVPLAMTSEFVDLYRQAGGECEFHTFEGLDHGFLLRDPDLPQAKQQVQFVQAFVQQHARP
ncbi:MAG: alpha/beta hydrolase [Chloroflexi bacterium]|nr:alpha/beta hydrolase [Chloroflexota bacterium]